MCFLKKKITLLYNWQNSLVNLSLSGYLCAEAALILLKIQILILFINCPIGKGCKIHRLHLCRGLTPQWVSWYDAKQSVGKVLVMLELWGMQSTTSSPFLPGPLCYGMVAPNRALSQGQIAVNCIFMLNWIAWIRTVWLNWLALNRNVFDYYI